jgi:hypothetical protein
MAGFNCALVGCGLQAAGVVRFNPIGLETSGVLGELLMKTLIITPHGDGTSCFSGYLWIPPDRGWGFSKRSELALKIRN